MAVPRANGVNFMRSDLFIALPLVALVAGCTVGPDYHAPEPRLASQWTSSATPGEVKEGAWWKTLNDPLLDTLVDEMLAKSPTLREAQARIVEARAALSSVRGSTGPQASLSGSASETVLSKNGQLPIGSIPGFARDFSLFDLGFDASWELDLWGRRTRSIEAANARTGQAEMAAQGVRLQLIGELARAYVELRLAQQEKGLAQEALEAWQNLDQLTALRERAGEANRMESERSASDFANARVSLANAEASERAAALRVAALVGVEPATMLPRLAAGAPIPAPPTAVAAGLPSELLRRRPDIHVAERDLAAATADVGVATADLFPRLRLGFSLGQQARAIGDLFDSDSTRLQAGPGLSWPIFSGGSTRARIGVANARVDQAAARYDAAVISALSDSETAINRFDRASAALSASDAALARDEAGYILADRRAAAGEDDRLALARARLAHNQALQRNAQIRAAATEAAIGLNKALGGGWKSGT
jgi:NodT family efflux transporter outer membrane factor (OMF) lipoprotein